MLFVTSGRSTESDDIRSSHLGLNFIFLFYSLPCDLTEHHTMNAYWGCGGISPPIVWPRRQWSWMFRFTPQPLYPQGKIPWYKFDTRVGRPQSPSGSGGEEKNSQPLPGLEPPDHPVRSPALYRRAIPPPFLLCYKSKYHCSRVKVLFEHLIIIFHVEVFWAVMPCSVVVGYQRFRGSWCL
jgi:hypothetical protein